MTKPYRPCNGSEGEWFESRFCDRCQADAAYRDDPDGMADGCPLLAWVYACDIDDPNYPKEWIEDEQGPRCTAFVQVSA